MSKCKKNAKFKHKIYNGRHMMPCHYCRKMLYPENATIDHIVPVSLGGKDERKNMVIACNRCNGTKGSSDYTTFKRKADEAVKRNMRVSAK